MSGWLAVAEKLLGRRDSELPSAYEIDCACGRKVSGARNATVQVTFCAACGTGLFVLPQSVYPRPHGVPPEPAKPPERVSRRRQRRPAQLASEAAPEVAEPVLRRPPGEPPAPRIIPNRDPAAELALSRPRRRLLTPVRLVLAGVAVVMGLTIWGSLRVRERNEAERTIASSLRLAQQALEENDLGEAARRYQEIRQALDVLGRTDSRARELRQAAAEITASADLSRSSLFDMLQEAVATTARSGRAMWDDTFRSSYRDEWVLIDANVSRTADAVADQRFEIEFPLAVGGQRAVLAGDLGCFDRVVQGGSSRRVIFAAQLEEFGSDQHGASNWRVALRPATAFLWTAPESLERLGVDVDEETRRILTEQASLMGMVQ